MTMPSKIWVNIGENEQTWLHSCNKHHTKPYIRADIAHELAWALEHSLEWVDSETTNQKMKNVLARYREASK